MSCKTKLPIWTAVVATAIALNFGGVATPALAEEVVLHMAVPDWPPTRIMKDLFNKNYKAPSGNHVKLDIDFIPWPDYYTRLNASLTSGEKKYNMAVSDSQWLGAFVEGAYYLKINKFVDRLFFAAQLNEVNTAFDHQLGQTAKIQDIHIA